MKAANNVHTATTWQSVDTEPGSGKQNFFTGSMNCCCNRPTSRPRSLSQLLLCGLLITQLVSSVAAAPVDEPFHDRKTSEGEQHVRFSGLSRESTKRPVALLICIHGIALCSQSYDSTASQLGNVGINVYAIDVRGFSSSGEANSRLDLPATLNDIANLIEQLKSHFPGTPVFILGESMGGNIALRFAELHQNMVDGIICSAPSGRLNKQRLLVLRSLALSLLTLRSPQKLFAASIINQSTTLCDLRRHIKENPEHRRNYSLPEVKQFLKFVKQSWRDRSKVSTKRLLMVQGFKDKLAVPCETAAMFRQIPVRKTLAVMTDQEHLIFEEKECPRSAAILVADFITDATSAEQGTESDGIIIGTSGRNCGKLRSIFKQAGINTDKIIESAF